MPRKIIDFHTHPYLSDDHNFCFYKESFRLHTDETVDFLKQQGISMICGSVIERTSSWEQIAACNREALELARMWEGFYMPGFHVHPGFLRESLDEIERMAANGVKLVGELVPYMHGWDFSHPDLPVLLEAMEKHGMILSVHGTGITDDVIMPLLERFPKLPFVAAHPDERKSVNTHLGRMVRFDNYYLDLSGSGLSRMGLLRYMIDRAGKDQILFGTDFPICTPAMYISVTEQDQFLTEDEKDHVFYKNAERLLFGGKK